MLRYANQAGKRLAERIDWQILRKEQTFTSLGQEEQTAALPSDLDRIIPETFWNRNEQELITGPITPVEWQAFKASDYQGYPTKFILRGGSIHISPAPPAGNTMAFEYISTLWAQSAASAAQTAFAADTDTSLIDENLLEDYIIFEWLTAEGQPAQHALERFIERLNTLVKHDQPSPRILSAGDIFGSGSRRFTGEPPGNGYYSIRGL